MTITEETRYQLYKKLEAELGADDANTLMEHLPPVGWADVATKQDLALLRGDLDLLRRDLDQLEERIGLRFETFEHRIGGRFEALEHRMEGWEHRLDASEQRLATALAETMHRQFVQTIASTAALLTVMLTLAVSVDQLLAR